MHKPILSLVMIIFTAGCTLGMVLKSEDELVAARIVTVRRGDVHQVTAVTGRLGYADEAYIYSRTSGIVSQICVEENQRVGSGEALIRLDPTRHEALVSAFLSESSKLTENIPSVWINEQVSLEDTVLRAETDATVRQLLVKENMPVAAGTPVIRVTSGQQEIVCTVAAVDAKQISPGMWGWISSEGEPKGFAEVIDISEPTADALTGKTSMTVILHPDQHIDLPEGAAVDVDIYLAGSDDVLTLPVEAITARETVWWVTDGRCTEISASVIMMDEILAWVALPEGTRVAVGEFEEGQYIKEAIP